MMSHTKEMVQKVAEAYVLSFLPNVPSNLKAAVEKGVIASVRAGLQPYPATDPQRELSKGAAALMKGLRSELPAGVSLQNREAHDFLSSLIGMVTVHLKDADLAFALSQVVEMDASSTNFAITGRLSAVLNDMVSALANDISRGATRGQHKAVRLLARMGLEDYEALQVLDSLVNSMSLTLSLTGAEFNAILDSYLSVQRAARVAGDIPATVERYVKEHKEQGMPEDKAWATAWSRYCVVGDTWVPTAGGLQTVSDLYTLSTGQKIVHSDGVTAKTAQLRVLARTGTSVASHIISTGVKSVVDMKTKHGYHLTCTPDHQVLVLNELDYSTEWIPAAKAVGRYVVLPTQGLWGTQVQLPPFSYQSRAWNNVLPFKHPTEMTHELARALGYLVAEGSITEEGVEFSNTNPTVVSDFVRCVSEIFGQDPTVTWHNRAAGGWKDCAKVRLRTRWFKEFFASVGLEVGTAQSKQIPHVILSAPEKFAREFLVGFVEGDGYTGDPDHLNRIDLTTSSPLLAEQLHLLLLNFGIPATLEETKRGYFNVRVHSESLASRYADRIGTAFKKIALSESRQELRGSEFELIPTKALFTLGSPVRSAFPGSKRVSLSRLARRWEVLESNRKGSMVSNIRDLMDEGYAFDKVVRVVDKGEAEVYDLSVPQSTSFVANGFIAHNCKYKKPGSPRCKQKEYFHGKGKSSMAQRIARTHIGGDLYAEYDGRRWLDVYSFEEEKPLLGITLGTLRKAIELFDPPPYLE